MPKFAHGCIVEGCWSHIIELNLCQTHIRRYIHVYITNLVTEFVYVGLAFLDQLYKHNLQAYHYLVVLIDTHGATSSLLDIASPVEAANEEMTILDCSTATNVCTAVSSPNTPHDTALQIGMNEGIHTLKTVL